KEIGPGGVESWRSKGGLLKLRSPAPGVMHDVLSGDIPEDLALPYVALVHQTAAQSPRAAVFVDSADMVNYETGFRLRATQAHRSTGARVEALHVLVVS